MPVCYKEVIRAEQPALPLNFTMLGFCWLLCFGVWWQGSTQEEKSSFKNMGIRKASHLF